MSTPIGSLEPQLLFELAARNDIALPDDDPSFSSVETLLARYRRFTSLDDFLHYYFIGMSVLITEADFEALAHAYFTKAKSQNVVHAEVFFDPQAHTSRGVAYQAIISGFKRAQERARSDYGITSELIVCMLRNFPVADCQRTYEEALPDLRSGKIRGLGLSSTEKGYPPSLFADIYADAVQNGIKHLTSHAGEEAGVSYMAEAVNDIHCVRVDHGIKLTEDQILMKRFADERIMVTICPLSNVELRCVRKIADLPIRTYLENKVPFSLNSDDPAYFGGYIQENYCGVQEAFDFSVQDWITITHDAIMLSWCDETRKTELVDQSNSYISQFGQR